MPYKADSFAASFIWGRVGAFVLGLAAFLLGLFGYVMTPEDVATAEQLIAGIFAGFGGVLALISKIREGRKAKE